MPDAFSLPANLNFPWCQWPNSFCAVLDLHNVCAIFILFELCNNIQQQCEVQQIWVFLGHKIYFLEDKNSLHVNNISFCRLHMCLQIPNYLICLTIVVWLTFPVKNLSSQLTHWELTLKLTVVGWGDKSELWKFKWKLS